jgi:hypothetical protein
MVWRAFDTIKRLDKFKIIVVTKIAVSLNTNKKKATEIQLCPASNDIILANFETSGVFLKISNAKETLQFDSDAPLKVKRTEILNSYLFLI